MAETKDESTAKIFKGAESGIIEIAGSTAEFMYDRMTKVQEKKTFAESTKVGGNIRCSKIGLDPKLKDSPSKKYVFKCYFRVDETGDATAIEVVR